MAIELSHLVAVLTALAGAVATLFGLLVKSHRHALKVTEEAWQAKVHGAERAGAEKVAGQDTLLRVRDDEVRHLRGLVEQARLASLDQAQERLKETRAMMEMLASTAAGANEALRDATAADERVEEAMKASHAVWGALGEVLREVRQSVNDLKARKP